MAYQALPQADFYVLAYSQTIIVNISKKNKSKQIKNFLAPRQT